MENQNRLTDVEAHALLDQLFPRGVAGPDVLAELAPAGWDQSPLLDPMDRRPPTMVLAYRSVFGRNPVGWPPMV